MIAKVTLESASREKSASSSGVLCNYKCPYIRSVKLVVTKTAAAAVVQAELEQLSTFWPTLAFKTISTERSLPTDRSLMQPFIPGNPLTPLSASAAAVPPTYSFPEPLSWRSFPGEAPVTICPLSTRSVAVCSVLKIESGNHLWHF